MPLSLFKEAALTIVFLTVAGEEPRLFAGTARRRPERCRGLALRRAVNVVPAVSLVSQADTMLEPGAKMSTTLPSFENDERASFIVDCFTAYCFADARTPPPRIRIRVACGNSISHSTGNRITHSRVAARSKCLRPDSCQPRQDLYDWM